MRFATAALMLLSLVPVPALAEERTQIWDVTLGTVADTIEADFIDYACGTNGGPPSIALAGFADFAQCPAEASGLHEVYFRYNERLQYQALALDRPADAARLGGTTVFDFPVVASFLFDEGGVLRGARIVTDPRPENHTERERQEFWTLGNLLSHSLADGWACTSEEPGARQHAVDLYFIKRHCTVVSGALAYAIDQTYLQRRGQAFLDPHTGRIQPDAFDSETRFEMVDADWLAAQPEVTP